jgi:hypothetical protein
VLVTGAFFVNILLLLQNNGTIFDIFCIASSRHVAAAAQSVTPISKIRASRARAAAVDRYGLTKKLISWLRNLAADAAWQHPNDMV